MQQNPVVTNPDTKTSPRHQIELTSWNDNPIEIIIYLKAIYSF